MSLNFSWCKVSYNFIARFGCLEVSQTLKLFAQCGEECMGISVFGQGEECMGISVFGQRSVACLDNSLEWNSFQTIKIESRDSPTNSTIDGSRTLPKFHILRIGIAIDNGPHDVAYSEFRDPSIFKTSFTIAREFKVSIFGLKTRTNVVSSGFQTNLPTFST